MMRKAGEGRELLTGRQAVWMALLMHAAIPRSELILELQDVGRWAPAPARLGFNPMGLGFRAWPELTGILQPPGRFAWCWGTKYTNSPAHAHPCILTLSSTLTHFIVWHMLEFSQRHVPPAVLTAPAQAYI